MDRPWLAQDLVWVLGSLCRIHRVPFDAALVAQQHPPPHSAVTFTEAATALGFRVGRCDTTGRKLPELTLPLIALLRTPDTAASADTAGPVLVVRADGDRVLYFRTHNNSGETVAAAEFTQHFEPEVLLVTHDARAQSPDDGLWSRETQGFGFRWFVPELLKHRTSSIS